MKPKTVPVWVVFCRGQDGSFTARDASPFRKAAMDSFRWSIAYRKGRPHDLSRLVRVDVPVPKKEGKKP